MKGKKRPKRSGAEALEEYLKARKRGEFKPPTLEDRLREGGINPFEVVEPWHLTRLEMAEISEHIAAEMDGFAGPPDYHGNERVYYEHRVECLKARVPLVLESWELESKAAGLDRQLQDKKGIAKAAAREVLAEHTRKGSVPAAPPIDTSAGEPSVGCAEDMLSLREAASYANVDERTIREWAKTVDRAGEPMLPNTFSSGRKIRIRRSDLDPWKKARKRTRTPAKTGPSRKAVKPRD